MAGRNVELHMLCGKLIPYLLQCKLRHLHVICMAKHQGCAWQAGMWSFTCSAGS